MQVLTPKKRLPNSMNRQSKSITISTVSQSKMEQLVSLKRRKMLITRLMPRKPKREQLECMRRLKLSTIKPIVKRQRKSHPRCTQKFLDWWQPSKILVKQLKIKTYPLIGTLHHRERPIRVGWSSLHQAVSEELTTHQVVTIELEETICFEDT